MLSLFRLWWQLVIYLPVLISTLELFFIHFSTHVLLQRGSERGLVVEFSCQSA